MRTGLLVAALLALTGAAVAAASWPLQAYLGRVAPIYAKFAFADGDAHDSIKAARAGLRRRPIGLDAIQNASSDLEGDARQIKRLSFSLAGVVPPDSLRSAHLGFAKSMKLLGSAYLELGGAYDQYVYDTETASSAGDLQAIVDDLHAINLLTGKLPGVERRARDLRKAWRSAVEAAAHRDHLPVPQWVLLAGY